MSGYKTTDYRIARERAEKLARMKSITALQAEAETLRGRINETLQHASSGLRRTFAGEVARAQQWLQAPEPAVGRLEMSTEQMALVGALELVKARAEDGRKAYESLLLAFTQKADALGQRLAQALTDADGQLVGNRKLLVLWYGEPKVQAWEAVLAQGRRQLDLEQYGALEPQLTALTKELGECIPSADAREEQQQKRLYLLKALRQVCAEMGYEEVAAPRYARDGDRGSALIMVVDTIARGKITFTLSFEGISTFSELADDHCPADFATITQYLEDEFGISTEFRGEDGKPIPKLIARGEMDEPSGRSRVMERE